MRPLALVISIVSVFLSSLPAFPTTYCVDDGSGNDLWDGLAPEWDGAHGPKKTIQAGINAASSSDTVMVAAGTYSGADNTNLWFSGKPLILMSSDGADETVIECMNSSRAFYFAPGDGSTMIQGFKIVNGFMSSSGGAIHCIGASPMIFDCIIEGCSTFNNGGGIYCYDSSMTISNCVISGNHANLDGGGIFFEGTSFASIVSTQICGNSADGDGGGLYLHSCDLSLLYSHVTENNSGTNGGGVYLVGVEGEISSCAVGGNTASGGGGGLYFACSDPDITNCMITGNSSGNWGGGLHLQGSYVYVLNSCTFTENSATDGGGALHCSEYDQPVKNCVFWNNTPDEVSSSAYSEPVLDYCIVEGGWFGSGSNNHDYDPLLSYAGPWKYRLSPGSPCIDAGTSDGAPPLDMEGGLRYDDPNVSNSGGGSSDYFDIGASEFRGYYVDGAFGSDSNDGLSPSILGGHGPKRTIQAAVDASSTGDVITVAPGVYTGAGNTDIHFDGRAITLASREGAEGTIIDCELTPYAFCFYISGEERDSVINGFTIRNAGYSSVGGGMFIQDCGATIMNSRITQCWASYGGAVFARHSDLDIIDCRIDYNFAQDGAGIWVDGGKPRIVRCKIEGNQAITFGGGVYCHGGSELTMTDCLVIGNSTTHPDFNLGSGVGCWGPLGDSYVTNCTFYGNLSATEDDGALGCYGTVPLQVTNCIFWGNTPGQIRDDFGAVAVRYSDVQGGTGQPWFQEHCIDVDPQFIHPEGGDYHLEWESPCVDTAWNSAPGISNYDLDGSPRIMYAKISTTVDMGPYEFGLFTPITGMQLVSTPGAAVEITWASRGLAGTLYTVHYSDGDLGKWYLLQADIPTAGSYTTYTDTSALSTAMRLYRVMLQD